MARSDLDDDRAEPEVSAAGGVLVRGEGESAEVAIIHRPKYEDWSLPKGKLEAGEDWLQAALREVEEETGYRCRPRRELPSVSYLDREGRRKLVRYWLMAPEGGAFEPHGEVDDLRWLSPERAAAQLSYEHDRNLVRETLAARR